MIRELIRFAFAGEKNKERGKYVYSALHQKNCIDE
jgi:hypothetical protein